MALAIFLNSWTLILWGADERCKETMTRDSVGYDRSTEQAAMRRDGDGTGRQGCLHHQKRILGNTEKVRKLGRTGREDRDAPG